MSLHWRCPYIYVEGHLRASFNCQQISIWQGLHGIEYPCLLNIRFIYPRCNNIHLGFTSVNITHLGWINCIFNGRIWNICYLFHTFHIMCNWINRIFSQGLNIWGGIYNLFTDVRCHCIGVDFTFTLNVILGLPSIVNRYQYDKVCMV